MRPLADRIEDGLVAWLPKPAYPDRSGVHANSAFALSRALPFAHRRQQSGAYALSDAITEAARRWYWHDIDYPSAFDSPMLAEIVLMRDLDLDGFFTTWHYRLNRRRFAGLSEPARVTDAGDGQGAHLHGLNLYSVHAFRRLAECVDPSEQDAFAAALDRHITAGLEALRAPGWMSEHWLAAYGVLAFR